MKWVNAVRWTMGVGMLAAIAVMAEVPSTARAATAAGDPVKGKALYTAQKCSLCHKIGDTGGKLGPDLSGVATKRDAAWLAKYLPNPKAADPKNKMPPVKVKPADLDDLVAYLLTLKGK